MTRVLVCGGRGFGERLRGVMFGSFQYIDDSYRIDRETKLLNETLDGVAGLRTGVLIHGACATGADRHADIWARRHGVLIERFKANWYPNGRSGGIDKSAGPRRTQLMIDKGRPDLVVAFRGGSGTADCVARARAAGIKVIEVE
jgi:hypothetical protein